MGLVRQSFERQMGNGDEAIVLSATRYSQKTPGRATGDRPVSRTRLGDGRRLRRGRADGDLGRETTAEVVLMSRLRAALERLNPDAPARHRRSHRGADPRPRRMSMVAANREVYKLLKDGVKVIAARTDDGDETVETVRVIDWNDPANNDFFLARSSGSRGEHATSGGPTWSASSTACRWSSSS